jgi:hypothetical protein
VGPDLAFVGVATNFSRSPDDLSRDLEDVIEQALIPLGAGQLAPAG